MDERLRELEVAARSARSDPNAWLAVAVAALRAERPRLAWEALDAGAGCATGGLLATFRLTRATLGEAWGVPFELEAISRASAATPRVVRFWKPRVTAGRFRGSDLVVEDPDVQGDHALFRAADGEVEVEGRFSECRVTVNGSERGRARLHPGDSVGLGRARFRYQRLARLPERPAVEPGALKRGLERALQGL